MSFKNKKSAQQAKKKTISLFFENGKILFMGQHDSYCRNFIVGTKFDSIDPISFVQRWEISKKKKKVHNLVLLIVIQNPTLIFGMLIILYVRNKNIEKNFLCKVGVLGSSKVKVTTKDNFFIYIDTFEI